MNVGIAYAKPTRQIWLKMDVPDGSTVREAIERSGLLEKFPEIDLENQKVGIFGRVTKLDKALQDGDRVEIYREIIADPELVERIDRDDNAE